MVHQVDVVGVAGVEGGAVVGRNGIARIVLQAVGGQEHLVGGARLQRLRGVEVDDAQLHAVGARQRVAAHRAHDEGVGVHALGPDAVGHAQADARGEGLLLRTVHGRDLLHFGLGGVGVHRMHDETAARAVVVADVDQVAERRHLAMVGAREIGMRRCEQSAAPDLDVVERVAHIDLVDVVLRALEHEVVLRAAVQLLVDHQPVVLGHEARAVAQVVAVHLAAALLCGGVDLLAVEAGGVVAGGGPGDGVEHLGIQRVRDVQAGEAAGVGHGRQHHVVAHGEDRSHAKAAELARRYRVGLAGAAVREHCVRGVCGVDDEHALLRRRHVQVGRLPPQLPAHVVVVALVDVGQHQLLHLLDVVDVGEVPELHAEDAGHGDVLLAADGGDADGMRLPQFLGAAVRLVDALDEPQVARIGDVVEQEAAGAQAAVGRERRQEVAVDHEAHVLAVVVLGVPGGGVRHAAPGDLRHVGAGAGADAGVDLLLDHRDGLEQLGLRVGQVAQSGSLQRQGIGHQVSGRGGHAGGSLPDRVEGVHPGDRRMRQQRTAEQKTYRKNFLGAHFHPRKFDRTPSFGGKRFDRNLAADACANGIEFRRESSNI
ncbi:hypothetical protein D3C87_1193700 [compost metagenome]